jgi:hypothetical protein
MGIKKDCHSVIRILKIPELNSEAINVAMGGPKTSQQTKAKKKSFKKIMIFF